MSEKMGSGVPPQERGENKEAEPKVLRFEGAEIFRQPQEQIDHIRRQMGEAQAALKTDSDAIAPRDLYGLAIEHGVRDKAYNTVRYGTIPDYSGEAEIEVNGRKYKAVGRGPRGTAEYVSKNGFIEFIPQEVPASIKEGTEQLTAEQIALHKMSRQQIELLNRRVNLAEKTLTQGFDQFTPDELRKLALEHGIRDKSYDTVRFGMVSDYSGEAEIVIKGEKYKAIGHGPRGSASSVSAEGYIEWRLVEGAGK